MLCRISSLLSLAPCNCKLSNRKSYITRLLSLIAAVFGLLCLIAAVLLVIAGIWYGKTESDAFYKRIDTYYELQPQRDSLTALLDSLYAVNAQDEITSIEQSDDYQTLIVPPKPPTGFSFAYMVTFFCIVIALILAALAALLLHLSRRYKIWFVVLAVVLLSGCGSRAEEGARDVVAQADSLRAAGKMYGVDAGDSASLARAYYALTPNYAARVLPEGCVKSLSTDYAHACYHYGRLLRAKDDPVSAMEVFINGTHTRTKDYHILGRIYSNMGSISHLAGEYQLAYDMYSRSADMFLKNKDTLLYYYALNNMAVELSVQGMKGEALNLLSTISTRCSDDAVLTKIVETRAMAYFYVQQYDSAICLAKQLYQLGNTEPTGILLCARAYSFLGVKDSAVYYAKQVVPISQDLFHLNNALYILTNDDDDKDKESIRQAAADRADIQKLLEIRQGKLSQATQLLVQDLNRKPDLRWLYVVIGVLLLICSCSILYYIWRKRKQHQRITQEIDIKRRQREQLAKGLASMHSEIHQLSNQQQKTHQQLLSDIEIMCTTLRNSKGLYQEPFWKDYRLLCELINQRFNNIIILLQKYSLSEREVRLCVLVLIGGISDKQMADGLYYSYNTIRSAKRHVALKLGTTSANLRSFLIKKVVESF